MAARANELKDLANKAVVKSDFAAAVALLTEAIALAPEMDALWSNRAFAHSALGQHTNALADARECIARAPRSAKGPLRAGRALVELHRADEAVALLRDASAAFPQDYGLQEALADALARAASASSVAVAPEPAGSTASCASGAAEGASAMGSAYYYAAVPASQRTLPVQPPQRIERSGATPTAAGAIATSGAVAHDIERKGADNSYYYAHARRTDYTVPTVPQKLNADGSLTPWTSGGQ